MLTDFKNMRLLRVKAGNSEIIRKALADGCKYITPGGKSAEKGPLANGVTSWALCATPFWWGSGITPA
jgi:hypothetical protein